MAYLIVCEQKIDFHAYKWKKKNEHFCNGNFLKSVTLIFDLDINRWLWLGANEKNLPQGIHMWHMKDLSLTIQKLWLILKFFENCDIDILSWL